MQSDQCPRKRRRLGLKHIQEKLQENSYWVINMGKGVQVLLMVESAEKREGASQDSKNKVNKRLIKTVIKSYQHVYLCTSIKLYTHIYAYTKCEKVKNANLICSFHYLSRASSFPVDQYRIFSLGSGGPCSHLHPPMK